MPIRDLFYHHSHNFLIPGRDGYLMFDCDWPGTLPKLFRALKQNAVRVSEIRYLLISHFHIDHAGSAEELKGLGVQLVVLDTQRDWLNAWTVYAARTPHQAYLPISDAGNRYLTVGESSAFLAEFGIYGQIISTPSHSPDSISLVLADGSAYIGDVTGPQWAMGPGAPDLRSSWQSLFSAGVKVAFPAHFNSFEVSPNDLL